MTRARRSQELLAWSREEGWISAAARFEPLGAGSSALSVVIAVDGAELAMTGGDFQRRRPFLCDPRDGSGEAFLAAFAAALDVALPKRRRGRARWPFQFWLLPMDEEETELGRVVWFKGIIGDFEATELYLEVVDGTGFARIGLKQSAERTIETLTALLRDGTDGASADPPVFAILAPWPGQRPVVVGDAAAEIIHGELWLARAGRKPRALAGLGPELTILDGDPYRSRLLVARGSRKSSELALFDPVTFEIVTLDVARGDARSDFDPMWDFADRGVALTMRAEGPSFSRAVTARISRDGGGEPIGDSATQTVVFDPETGARRATLPGLAVQWEPDGLLLETSELTMKPARLVKWSSRDGALAPAEWRGFVSPDGRFAVGLDAEVYAGGALTGRRAPEPISWFTVTMPARVRRCAWVGPHGLVVRARSERRRRVVDLEAQNERPLFADPTLELLGASADGALAIARDLAGRCLLCGA